MHPGMLICPVIKLIMIFIHLGIIVGFKLSGIVIWFCGTHAGISNVKCVIMINEINSVVSISDCNLSYS